MNWYLQALPAVTSVASGLLIGIERGWKLRRERAGSRVAGVRTFTLLGLLGGLAGLIAAKGYDLLPAVFLIPTVAILVIGYARRSGEDRRLPRSAHVGRAAGRPSRERTVVERTAATATVGPALAAE